MESFPYIRDAFFILGSSRQLVNQKKAFLCSQNIEINKPVNIIAAINFKKEEVRNPIKEPKAAFKAFLEFLLSLIISPIKAPANGPIIIPKGPKKSIPMSKPSIVPIIP